jgi:CBS domain-containing protein/RNA polymerase-binding transcription factor DksA
MSDTVKEWMSGDPVSIAADASALEALERMQDRGIRHLPVLDASKRVIGVLSIDDLRAALPFDVSLREAAHGADAESAREWCVGDVMTHAPVTLQETDSLAEAAERMAARRIGCLPIVDEKGRLAGILSETDLLNALASLLWANRREKRRPAPLPELERLVADLTREREALLRRRDRYHAAERELSTHAQREPLDMADEGADRTEFLLTEALDEHALRRLRALDHALERADQGVLDTCDSCGRRIPLARLRALPGTSQCIDCARRAERG